MDTINVPFVIRGPSMQCWNTAVFASVILVCLNIKNLISVLTYTHLYFIHPSIHSSVSWNRLSYSGLQGSWICPGGYRCMAGNKPGWGTIPTHRRAYLHTIHIYGHCGMSNWSWHVFGFWMETGVPRENTTTTQRKYANIHLEPWQQPKPRGVRRQC